MLQMKQLLFNVLYQLLIYQFYKLIFLSDNEILSVILETEGSEALLCNLCKQKGILQESLDLNFMTGDRVTFECRGHGRIHLTGQFAI